MKANKLWIIFWGVNIFYDLILFSIPTLYIYYSGDINATSRIDKLLSQYNDVIIALAVITFIFWIYNIIIWNRKKGSTLNLLLLIFLNGIYTPLYYYLKVIRDKY